MLFSQVLTKTVRVAKLGSGVGRNNNYKLAATLYDKKGRILATRVNTYKTHPKLKDYYNHPCLHAEAHAIISNGIKESKGASLLVVRVLADDSISMAKPCGGCCRLIEDVGIKEVFYSNWNGEIVSL